MDPPPIPRAGCLTRRGAQIEFPSILLPPDISSGSIVDITVGRNAASESTAEAAFTALQERIYAAFGAAEPETPVLRCRNATQTSVVLEWDPVVLATADLVSLALYRNGQKAGNIPRPLAMHSTKISGLAVDTGYEFHLVLRTSAGTLASDRVAVRTHKMTDLSGVTITTGILPAAARDALARAVTRIGARLVDGVRIDTTHFVTTEGRGVQWEKAVEMNIPVVRPEWVDACEHNGRILGVTKFYLDALRPPPTPGAADDQRPAPGPPGQQQQQKDLPPPPPADKENGGAADDESKTPRPPGARDKEEGAGGEEDDSEDDDEEEAEAEAQKSARHEEQKVRIDEKDRQKVALRPGHAKENQAPSDEDDDDDDDGTDDEKKPSGDGASFQDVAL